MTWVVYLRQSSPEPSALIGASPGTSAWLVTLAPRPLPRSLSPFMVFLRPLLTSMALASSRQKRGAQTPLNPSSSPIQFDLAGFLSYFWSIYHSFPLHFPSFFNTRVRSLVDACFLLVAHHVGTGPPILIISPSELDFGTLLVGSTATLQVAVSNTGGQPLTWNVDTGGTRWLSVVPDSGTIPTGGQQAINVTANASSLAPGTYTADLNLTSNGGNTSLSLKVVLVVT